MFAAYPYYADPLWPQNSLSCGRIFKRPLLKVRIAPRKKNSVEDGDADKGRSETMQGAEAVRKASRFPSGADLRMDIGHAAYPVPTKIMAP